MKKGIVYVVYLFFCIEIFSKILLFVPWINQRIVQCDTASAWRVRWVHRYLVSRLERKLYYPFDQYDATKGWSLKPGLKNFPYGDGKILNSNAMGMRGAQEYLLEKKVGISRILFSGDSFVFGEGASDDETIPYFLEKSFNGSTEVMNFGIHGYAHDQMLIRLKEQGLAFKPDRVVLGFFSRDMQRNLLDFRDFEKPRFLLKDGRLSLQNSPVPKPEQVLQREFFKLHFLDIISIARHVLDKVTGRNAEEQSRITTALLDEMWNSSKEIEAKFVIVHIPSAEEISSGGSPNNVEQWLERYAGPRSIEVIYPLQTMNNKIKVGSEYKKSGHYNTLMNRDLADFLYRRLSVLANRTN